MALSLPPPRVRPWTRTRLETKGSFRVFDVLESECVRPDGRPCPHPLYTVRCATWTNVLAFTDDDEAIFVWQYRHGTEALSLELPGGMVDANEQPMDAAHRELREETGYGVDHFTTLLTVHPNPALQGNVQHTFLGYRARLVGEPKFDESEECEVALVPRRDLAALVDEGHTTHALTTGAIDRFLRRG